MSQRLNTERAPESLKEARTDDSVSSQPLPAYSKFLRAGGTVSEVSSLDQNDCGRASTHAMLPQELTFDNAKRHPLEQRC